MNQPKANAEFVCAMESVLDVIRADAGELRRLRERHDLPRTWANKARLAEPKTAKPRPAR